MMRRSGNSLIGSLVAAGIGIGSLVAATVGLSSPAAADSGAADSKSAVLGAADSGAARQAPSWQLLSTGSTSHFRGLSPVSRNVAWIGGYSGLVMRTVDGGRSWADVSPAEAAGLQFRDISAFDA